MAESVTNARGIQEAEGPDPQAPLFCLSSATTPLATLLVEMRVKYFS